MTIPTASTQTGSGPWDLGDTIALTCSATDADNNATDCTGMTLTVTRPDGTTETPAVTNPPEFPGAYRVDYVPTQVGRHAVRWVGTGPAFAYSDVFDVMPALPSFIISLADAREHLRRSRRGSTATPDDAQLRLYLAAVTPIIDDAVGPQGLTSETVTADGGVSSILLPTRVVSVTSVTESGAALSAGSDYTVNLTSGIVSRGTYRVNTIFAPGLQNVVITYLSGGSVIGENVRLAARIILGHLWQADQQGYRPAVGGGPENDTVVTPSGFAIPRRAAELLKPSSGTQMPGFA